MDDKKLTLICVVIIILVAIGVTCVYFIETANDKTTLKITSNSTLANGDLFTVKLANEDGVGIANKTINVVVDGGSDNINDLNITTDENGTASFNIDANAGNYSVKCDFKGDDNYQSSADTQNLTIKEGSTELISSSSALSPEERGYRWSKQCGMYIKYDSNSQHYDPSSNSYKPGGYIDLEGNMVDID